ncbi:hypothetical protein HRbin11_02391 [bacterium HR11]|nr:hypothetical protein HRbin11_02391 [bacterium HR11]
MSFHEAFQRLLQAFIAQCEQIWRDRLVAVVLYGPYAHRLVHTQRDVDLLVVAEGLPASPWDRYDVVMDLMERLEPALQDVYETVGFYLYVSPVLKTPSELEGLDTPYIRLVRQGRVLYDRDDWFQRHFPPLPASEA